MIRHDDTDVSLQYSKTDDRIFDLHKVSQLESNRYEQIITLTDEHNWTMDFPDFPD
jgi:hypothetical protein